MNEEEMRKELAELEVKAFKLIGKAKAEAYPPKKREYQEDRAILLPKINVLREKLNETENRNAWETLINNLKEQRKFTVLEVNGKKIEIPENLVVKIPHDKCGHTQELHLAELLRYKKVIPSNIFLLNEWNKLLQHAESGVQEIRGLWHCEQCREDANSLMVKMGIRKSKPHGTALWKLQHFRM